MVYSVSQFVQTAGSAPGRWKNVPPSSGKRPVKVGFHQPTNECELWWVKTHANHKHTLMNYW